MKIRLIWKFIPVPIFITNWLIPSKFAGYHIVDIVLIRPEYKDDEGLIQHELTHVKQNIRTFMWSGIRQYWDKNHKLDRECEAYAVQLQYVPIPQRDVMRKRFVNFIYTKYNLGMSKNFIRRRFEQVIRKVGEG
jgi:hypothetical protein